MTLNIHVHRDGKASATDGTLDGGVLDVVAKLNSLANVTPDDEHGLEMIENFLASSYGTNMESGEITTEYKWVKCPPPEYFKEICCRIQTFNINDGGTKPVLVSTELASPQAEAE